MRVNAKADLGMKVNLVFGDTESQPQKGVAVVKKLISRDKVLVVGAATTAMLILPHQKCASAENTERDLYCPGPIITAKGYTYVFRTAPTAVQVVAWNKRMA
jgi:ABC-type branched-subunit amino acid transport system substrate-binding protein